MSELTLDTAIKHCLDVAEQNEISAITYKNCKEIKANMYEKLTAEKAENDCRECAADHRQLAEWLTDYKELKNSIGAVKLKDMEEAVRLLQELNTENDQLTSQLTEAKKLLKLAIEDLEELHSEADCSCNCCKGEKAESCQFIKCWTWRYTDEALKLIGDEPNGI